MDPSIPIDGQIRNVEVVLFQVLTRVQNRMMFDRGGNDVMSAISAPLKFRESLYGVIVCFCPAASKHDFARTLCANQIRHLFASRVNRVACLPPKGVDTRSITKPICKVGRHRFQHVGMQGRCCVMVEIDSFH